MHLRHDFVKLGILPVINRLKIFNIAQLNKWDHTHITSTIIIARMLN